MTLYLVVGLIVAAAMGLAFYGLSRAMQPTEGVGEQIEKWISQGSQRGGRGPVKAAVRLWHGKAA